MDNSSIKRGAKSAPDNGAGRQTDNPTQEYMAREGRLSEVWLARSFADEIVRRFIHVANIGWHEWSYSYWRPDHEAKAVREAAFQFLEDFAWPRPAIKKLILIRKMVDAVATLNSIRVRPEDLDRCPELLALPNGVVNLTRAAVSEASPDNYMTLRAGAVIPLGQVKYDPHDAPLWEAFLNRVLPDQSVRDYLQVLMGYAATGYAREHLLLFAYGTGANGKSVFVETICRALGDYAQTAESEMFMLQRHREHTQELAVLRGARLVCAGEVRERARWNVARVKEMTGGDKITARHMRQDNIQFDPQWTILLSGNHRPKLASVDEAIRRRIRILPFTETIPAGERDPKLAERLADEDELDGVLKWIIEGAREYLADGLPDAPDAVREATDDYLSSEDWIGEVVDGVFERKPGADTLTLKQAQEVAAWWAGQQDYYTPKRGELKDAMERAGYPHRRDTHGGRRVFRDAVVRADVLDDMPSHSVS